VALSNVLYAHSMALAMDPDGTHGFFAGWHARVLQHLFLYPVLLACIWGSLRVGWRPLYRAIPIQLALGLVFAMLATPVLGCCEWLVGEGKAHSEPWSMGSLGGSMAVKTHHDYSTWIAGTTSFLLTYGFALALVMGFALYRRFKESELRRTARCAAHAALAPHAIQSIAYDPRADRLGSGRGAADGRAARRSVAKAPRRRRARPLSARGGDRVCAALSRAAAPALCGS